MKKNNQEKEPGSGEEFLIIDKVQKQTGKDFLLQAISFTHPKHQNLVVAGATGSGKSTLLKIIAGLVQPDNGTVHFEKERVLGPDEKLIPGHGGIGYLSQYFELRNNYYVYEELECVNELPAEEAKAIYDICRISHLLHRRTSQLSGGEKQRIVTARLLTTRPRLLLLDEPYSNLDMQHKQIMKSVVQDIGNRLDITCVLISHDPLDSLSWADEIIVLKEGRLVQKATPEIIYQQPADAYTAGLFGKYTLLDAALVYALFGDQVPVPEGKQLLVRPEQFQLTDNAENGTAGLVQQVRFYGSYYEADILFKDKVIITRADTCPWKQGDKVSVTITTEQLWFV